MRSPSPIAAHNCSVLFVFIVNSISRICSFIVTTEKVPAPVFRWQHKTLDPAKKLAAFVSRWERRALALRKTIANTRGFSPGPSLPIHNKILLAAATLLAAIFILPLTGCSSGMVQSQPDPHPTPTPPTNFYLGTAFSGKVFSGATPIQGASIQLYAAGTTGNGSAATSLLDVHNRCHRFFQCPRWLFLPQCNIAALPHRSRRQSRRPNRHKQSSHSLSHRPRSL